MATVNFDPEKVFFGITPTSWWNDDFLDIDIGIPFQQCVSEMALAGFQGCSVGHKYPTDVELLTRELELRGLRVSEPWTSLFFTRKEMREKTIKDFRNSLAFIKAMKGTDLVVAELGHSVHQRPIRDRPQPANFRRQAVGIAHIGAQRDWRDRQERGNAALLPPSYGNRGHDPGRRRSPDGLDPS